MKRLVRFFIRQNLFGDLLTAVVILLGIASLFWIRREVFPNVDFDVVTVTTIYPGAAPAEVEKLITNPLEQDLKEVDGIKRLESFSTEGRSAIVVHLDPDQTTGDGGKADIQDVVDRFQDLPSGAEEPDVLLLESKQAPIIEVSLSGNLPELELRAIARQLEQEIEELPGIARVVHTGLRDVEIRVEADLDRLARYRLSLDDLVAALRRQNVSVPAGTIEAPRLGRQLEIGDGKERIVRTIGDFASLEDVRKTVIRANDLGQAIAVGQVAKVSYQLERAELLTLTRGEPSLNLTVLIKEKSDAVEAVDRVRARINELKPTLDQRVNITFINDFSDFIRRRLSILTGNLLIGLGLVLLMLPLLIPFRFSLLIALGEPFAFLGTILLLYVFGASINLISMIGLIIVSGILVDDSIVVTENAVRMVEEGADPKSAALKGTLQIMAPVAASVACTTTAFLPMLFMSGIFGKFVREIPIAVLTALGMSLFETFFILPAHIAHWIQRPEGIQGQKGIKAQAGRGVFVQIVEKSRHVWDRSIVPRYLRWLKVSLRHRYWVAAGVTGLLAVSTLLATRAMKFVLFPPEGIEIFLIRVDAPVGTSLSQMAQLVRPVEKLVQALPAPELDTYTTLLGIQQQDPQDPFTRRGSHFAQVNVFLTPEPNRERIAAEIIEDLRQRIDLPPGIKRINFERINTGPPTGKPVSIGVRARNYAQLLPAVAELETFLKSQDGVTDLANSYTLGKRELRLNVNSAEAAAAQLAVAEIGNTVRAAYEGIIATTVRELDEEIDVRVSLSRKERETPASLQELLVPNAVGNLVPLSRVSRVTEAQSLSVYEHEANQRQVKVTADVDTTKTSALEVNNRIRRMIPELEKKFPGVTFAFGGEDEDTQESLVSLFRAFVAAILGIFLILVLTFRSLLQPLIILLTVPLGVIAVIWAFFLHGLPLSFMGCLGIIALAGVIVNNAIVLVDFINQRRARGSGPMRSIMEASETRVRPIFLTTFTTVVGILPTAYGLGGLDLFVVPIAMALGWGLMFGSILTAFVFPATLAILDDLQGFLLRRFRRSRKA